jgi:hypothetical protein
MTELFDIIPAVNRLKDRVDYLCSRIDFLCRYPSVLEAEKYVDEKTACRILRLKRTTFLLLRKKGEIEFIRHHRKNLYTLESIHRYLESQKQDTQPPPP